MWGFFSLSQSRHTCLMNDPGRQAPETNFSTQERDCFSGFSGILFQLTSFLIRKKYRGTEGMLSIFTRYLASSLLHKMTHRESHCKKNMLGQIDSWC